MSITRVKLEDGDFEGMPSDDPPENVGLTGCPHSFVHII